MNRSIFTHTAHWFKGTLSALFPRKVFGLLYFMQIISSTIDSIMLNFLTAALFPCSSVWLIALRLKSASLSCHFYRCHFGALIHTHTHIPWYCWCTVILLREASDCSSSDNPSSDAALYLTEVAFWQVFNAAYHRKPVRKYSNPWFTLAGRWESQLTGESMPRPSPMIMSTG